ncbi:hypothetical protein SKAU_G00235530 [Synaphobranchus kaupii]|uniref:Uncharacterized protein n=1 Tax=Synaphobranchus kaupii TaxID=118154 RepID=A0A9Q1ITD4_SYNKA|nr:hypothetical protein SKAU_G00235530 [Synaphobranchus kaupii]
MSVTQLQAVREMVPKPGLGLCCENSHPLTSSRALKARVSELPVHERPPPRDAMRPQPGPGQPDGQQARAIHHVPVFAGTSCGGRTPRPHPATTKRLVQGSQAPHRSHTGVQPVSPYGPGNHSSPARTLTRCKRWLPLFPSEHLLCSVFECGSLSCASVGCGEGFHSVSIRCVRVYVCRGG